MEQNTVKSTRGMGKSHRCLRITLKRYSGQMSSSVWIFIGLQNLEIGNILQREPLQDNLLKNTNLGTTVQMAKTETKIHGAKWWERSRIDFDREAGASPQS